MDRELQERGLAVRRQVLGAAYVDNAMRNADQPGRYAAPELVGTERREIFGFVPLETICTSHAERLNLTTRTLLKRFTRLSLCFSKKLENLAAAIALHVAHYNFCRVHRTLRCTPAMAAGVVGEAWELSDLLAALR